MKVWKYPLPQPTSTGRAFIDARAGFIPLSIGMQDDTLVVWGLADEEALEGMRRFIVVNTGVDPFLPEGARFLGTVTSSTGVVWHVWDGDAGAEA